MKTEEIAITTDHITLGSVLKMSGAAETGGAAKLIISSGKASVNGEVCTQRGKKLRDGDVVCLDEIGYRLTIKKTDTDGSDA